MRGHKDEPALEEISESECVELLSSHTLGRLALIVDGRPQIFPVTYAVRQGIVVFRTAPGTKLAHAPGSAVAFEIDGYEAAEGVGWSVVVQGTARNVTDAGDDFAWAARGAAVYPLAPGTRVHRVAIEPTSITGRRFKVEG